MGGPSAGLGTVELAIRAAMVQLGGSLLQRLLAADDGHRGPRVDCGAGHTAGFVAYRAKTLDTVLGPVTVRRAGRDRADYQAGGTLGRGRRTIAAQTIAAQADAIRTRRLVPLPPADPPDMLHVAIDGTGGPMVPADTAGRTGKAADGKARSREVKLACVFTQTGLDHDGHPRCDPDSSSYLATFEPAAQFGVLMAAEARRHGAEHIRQLVVLGDGTPWILNLAAKHFPHATGIVDLYHARGHLHDLAATLAFINGDHHAAWLADRLTDLDHGRIESLCNAAYDLPLVGVKAADRDKALAYFDTNAVRMRYGRFRDLGMFVGSGAVEAGRKAVIGQRLKLSGMRWALPGATGILTLRCQQASGRLDQIWQPPHNQTPAA